jgi:small subunit ribosomal protein S18
LAEEKKKFIRKRRKKICVFCAGKAIVDYKNLELLRRFITDRGKIMNQRSSGCCAKHQRAVSNAIKRGRQIGFVPYVVE